MKLKLPKGFPQPFSRGVIVLPIDKGEQKTDSGLVIPDFATGAQNEERNPKLGRVCCIGPDVDRYIIDDKGKKRIIQNGDKVSYNPYADSGFLMEGVFYIIMDKEDVKAYWPEDTKATPANTPVPSRKRAAVEKAKMKYQ